MTTELHIKTYMIKKYIQIPILQKSTYIDIYNKQLHIKTYITKKDYICRHTLPIYTNIDHI